MLKKLFLTAIVALALVGTVSAQAKVYKVAFVARAQADAFAAWLTNSIVQEAAKYKDIKLTVFDGQANDDVENSLIENAITNKFDVIVIQPNNGESQRPYAVKVVQAGIFCITTNARIAGIAGASSVDADPYMQAAVVARLALKQVPKNAKVVVLDGPPGNFHADSRRVSWQKEFFDKRPDVKILDEQIANWNKDEALRLMEDWIQAHPKIDAVISMNDNMAAGAIEAIKSSGAKTYPFIYGVDGTAEACLLIKDGKMTSTSLQNANLLAVRSMKLAHDLLIGEKADLHQTIDADLITKDNVDKFIELHKSLGNIK